MKLYSIPYKKYLIKIIESNDVQKKLNTNLLLNSVFLLLSMIKLLPNLIS